MSAYSKGGKAVVEGVEAMAKKYKGRKVGPHTISPEGDADIAVQELAERKMREGKSSEVAFEEAERAVGQNVEGATLPKSSVWERMTTDTNSFEPRIPTKTKVAAGTAAAAVPVSFALWNAEDKTLGKKPDKIEDRSEKEHEKAVEKAQKAIDDKKKNIDDSIDDLIDGADAGSSSYPMPGAYRPFKFERTDFSESLKDDLKVIGSKYEQELKALDDKEAEGKDRAVMKNILKGLIDAAALMYLAKHAPTAANPTPTDKREYERELDRLEGHMNTQRNLVKEKFSELRAQTKDRYRTAERGEDKAESTSARDYSGQQRHQSEVQRAREGMFRDNKSAADQRRKEKLRELQLERKSLDKGAEPSKGDRTTERQRLTKLYSAEQANKKQFTEMLKNSDKITLEEFKGRLSEMGATNDEINAAVGTESDEWYGEANMENVLKKLPAGFSASLAERQVGRIYGNDTRTAPSAPRTERQEERRQYNEKLDKTRIYYRDGSMEMIDGK